VALDQQEISIYSKQYEYIIDKESKIITLPSPPGVHAGMKRHYYFRENFSKTYHISMINQESWKKVKETNEVKILKIKE
jgi:hypothetical protein